LNYTRSGPTVPDCRPSLIPPLPTAAITSPPAPATFG